MKEVLKIFETTMKQEVQSICIFPGGFSNNNYLINNDYIMRRKKIYIQPFYDSICEKGIEEFLKDKGCFEDGHASERVVEKIKEIIGEK